jgi:very-short-patch-repair endonuclease
MVKLRGKTDYPFYFGASPEILKKAGSLRHSMTYAEKLMWNYLRNRNVVGCKFRRQHSINNFIADFYCHEAKLVIEIDGSIHNSAEQAERDIQRTIILEQFGIKVLRFTNHDVENRSEEIIEEITRMVIERT